MTQTAQHLIAVVHGEFKAAIGTAFLCGASQQVKTLSLFFIASALVSIDLKIDPNEKFQAV